MEKVELRMAPGSRTLIRRGLAAARKLRRLPKLSQNDYLCELMNAQLDRELAALAGVKK